MQAREGTQRPKPTLHGSPKIGRIVRQCYHRTTRRLDMILWRLVTLELGRDVPKAVDAEAT
jgi:hypothetical protein